jgi:hypothetical protein
VASSSRALTQAWHSRKAARSGGSSTVAVAQLLRYCGSSPPRRS